MKLYNFYRKYPIVKIIMLKYKKIKCKTHVKILKFLCNKVVTKYKWKAGDPQYLHEVLHPCRQGYHEGYISTMQHYLYVSTREAKYSIFSWKFYAKKFAKSTMNFA